MLAVPLLTPVKTFLTVTMIAASMNEKGLGQDRHVSFLTHHPHHLNICCFHATTDFQERNRLQLSLADVVLNCHIDGLHGQYNSAAYSTVNSVHWML